MDIYTATEQAYKNGYANAVKKFANYLKEHSCSYDIVLINADEETRRCRDGFPYTEATCVWKGFNELDGCVIIDDYVEDENEIF